MNEVGVRVCRAACADVIRHSKESWTCSPLQSTKSSLNRKLDREREEEEEEESRGGNYRRKNGGAGGEKVRKVSFSRGTRREARKRPGTGRRREYLERKNRG